VPENSPGRVDDAEVLVRFVEQKAHVLRYDDGSSCLLPTAVSEDDLRGRGFSVFREAHINADEMHSRASDRTKAVEWKNDPVLARACVDGGVATSVEIGLRRSPAV
jgi:hypothetical protein